MKNHCVRILSAFFGLAALAITAKGQVPDRIVVNIPYEFVVAGKTLPAGTYTVNRVSVGDEHLLSKIATSEHVFTIPVSSSAVLQAGMKGHNGPSEPMGLGKK